MKLVNTISDRSNETSGQARDGKPPMSVRSDRR